MPILRFFCLVVTLVLATAPGHAQTEPTPEKVRTLLQVLADPEVQRWIEQQRLAPAAPAAAQGSSGEGLMAGQIDAIRAHIASVRAALPRVPGVLEDVWGRVRGEMESYGSGGVLVLVPD